MGELGPFFDPPLAPLDRPDVLKVWTRDGDKFVGEELIFRGFDAIIGIAQLALYFPEMIKKNSNRNPKWKIQSEHGRLKSSTFLLRRYQTF